jgi:hypothetical protein
MRQGRAFESIAKDIGTKRYCPARWIQHKLGTFKRPLVKREVQMFLEKYALPPFSESPYKSISHLIQLLATAL